MPQLRAFNQLDLSGGLQSATSHLLRKRNEVVSSKNAAFNIKIGSAVRRPGYEKVARTIEHGNDSLGAIVYKYGQNNKIIVGINDVTSTYSTLRVLDTADYWTTILSNSTHSGIPPNVRFQMINDLDQLYVAGYSSGYGYYLPLTNIDSTLVPSLSRNVYTAPACRFIAEYNNELYAINCMVNGKSYPDRFYKSSPPLGAITFIQTDQKGLLKQLRVDSTQYLKVGMQVDIYGAGTEAKKVSALTIVSIDKKNERITFLDTTIDVADNDEIWLTGTKGTLSRFWNTDYRTPETADWERVPASKESRPTFTGWGKNNNRLFLFTKNSFLKWDGANLITVSDTIGCVSHETIQNIGPWTIWLHNTGVYGYNDNSGGEPKLLSRAIANYIQAINQVNLEKTSAGVSGRVYKLSLGELLPLDSVTTSTSTSSTSTSSTSSSTSSTSTSSTSTSSTSSSTSSTSTSTSRSTTSTSSTSSSTTSISTSSTSTSVSTSTSSTTTTTLLSTKEVVRLCYDFDMNAWWPETHRREIRFQFNHTMNGYTKPYFTDDTGRLFRDETGNLDNADPIPMEIELGRNNFGSDQSKNYHSILVDSEKARAAVLQCSIDNGQFQTYPGWQITENVQQMVFPQGGQLLEGRDINYKFVHNDRGEAPVINGLSTYYSSNEAIPNEVI